MKGLLTGLTKVLLGVSIAFILLSLTGVATARYFMAKLSVLPPRPVFNNDAVSQPPDSEAPAPSDAAPATPTNDESAAAPAPERPPGSYDAVVIQPIGLVLRSGPGAEHEQLGGVDYEDEVLVLQTSDDGGWLNVRVDDSGQEGWVKAGNTRNLNEPAPQ